jgi:hypothetical protein
MGYLFCTSKIGRYDFIRALYRFVVPFQRLKNRKLPIRLNLKMKLGLC